MKVAIIGFGAEGQAAYRYWEKQDAHITIHDLNPDLATPDGAQTVLGPRYLDKLSGYDVIVRSPGVAPWKIKTTARVTSVTQEFFERCPAKIIGVTGTKGKGTTSSLITEILKAAGRRVWLGGNIGTPPLDFLDQVEADDLVVLELSSFQLLDLHQSPAVGVLLMVVPEHQDWHRSMREYVAAKGNIFWHQRPEDLAVYNAKNEYSTEMAQLSPGRRMPYLAKPGAYVKKDRIVMDETDICGVEEVGLPGVHNLENVCAAITATWELVGRRAEPVREAVAAFTGLPHRLELVREVGGVRYFNDSFATTPEAAIAAIMTFPEPKVIILGGSDKRSDYAKLAKVVKEQKVRQAILIGDTAPRLRASLEATGFEAITMGLRLMPEIVAAARDAAQSGDIVLLTPGCASFGLFENYKDRGEQFKAAVRALRAS